MAQELATAYISLAVSGKGLRKDIDKAVGASSAGAERSGKGLGGRMASGLGTALKAGGLAAGALGAGALIKGFGRLNALDQAEAKLTGLGHSTKTVKGIMDNALSSVKGTAFGMDEAATTAAGTVAAGIKPGKELESVLTLVGDAATIGGTSMSEMGSIFNKVASSNKVQGDVINQLNERGIPIVQLLGKEMGVSAEEVYKLSQAGEIGFDDFRAAMESGLGGAAQESGKTFSGAFKNMGAAAGRLGASLLSGVFPKMRNGFGGVTNLLDRMGPAAERWGNAFGSALAGLGGKVSAFFRDFKNGEGFAGELRDELARIGSFIMTTVVPALAAFGGWVRDRILPAVADLGGWLWKNRATLAALVAGVLAGVVAFKAFMFIKTVIAAVKAARIAVLAFNASLLANPLGMVAIAIGVVVAALILLYKRNATVRKMMQQAWAGIKAAVSSVVSWFKGTAWPVMRTVFQAIGNVIKWLWNNVAKPYGRFLVAYWSTVFGFLRKWVWPVVKRVFSDIGRIVKWLWSNAVKPYFGFIKRLASQVFGWVKNTGWPWMKRALSAIGGAAKSLWSRFIKPYFGFIKRTASSVFGWIKNKGWPLIKVAFDNIAKRASWLWGKVKWAFDKLKGGASSVKNAIVKARDGIKSAWSKLNGILRAPISKALKWMNRNFIGKLNTMLGKIPGVDLKIPKIPGFATGGYTGRGSKYEPAGIVHRDEYVIRKEARARFERKNPGVLDHLNRTGDIPGYRIGGKVGGLNERFLNMLHAFNAAAGGRYSVYSGYRSNAKQRVLYNRYLAGRGPVAAKPGSSMHNRGLAADLAPSNARDVHGGLARRMGLVFTVPSESWHIEPSWGRGSSAGPGSGGDSGGGWLPEWVRDAAGWVKGKIASLTKGFDASKYGLAGEILPSVFNEVRGAVTKKVKEAASLFDFGGGGSMDFSGIKKGPNLIMGKEMAKRYGWTGGQWSALKVLWNKESGWNHKAKNPSSGAYGIPQSLPASKMASEGSDWRDNPVTQIAWGLKYIKQRYGNPGRALSFHNRRNWYADGGLVRPPVFDNGGTLAPGLNLVDNKLGRPEALVRPESMPEPVVNVFIDGDGEGLSQFIRAEVSFERDFSGAVGRMG